MDYYKQLGIKESASPEEIKKAYKKLAMKHHPDRGGDPDIFNKITNAYDTLTDPKKKQKYDNKTNHSNFKNFNFSKSNFTGFASTRPTGFYGLQEKMINANVTVEYTITLEQAFQGGTHTIEYMLDNELEKIQLEIPKFVDKDQTFHFAHRGENRFSHQPRGDLYVKIKISEDENYWFDNKTLCSKVVIDIFEAIFGCSKNVKLPNGHELKFDVKPGSQAGTKYRFKNAGYSKNDFIVYLVVSTPKIENNEILVKLKEIEDLIKQDQLQK